MACDVECYASWTGREARSTTLAMSFRLQFVLQFIDRVLLVFAGLLRAVDRFVGERGVAGGTLVVEQDGAPQALLVS